MRKIDKKKNLNEKVLKTINFDKIVVEKLEERCAREGTKVSTFVNHFIREIVMNDLQWFEELHKQAAMQMNEYDYMIKKLIAKRETKNIDEHKLNS